MRRKLEVCVDTAEGARICAEAQVDRIELCSALSVGGLTPTSGLMQFSSSLPVPVHAMIRPRDGDFIFDTNDVDVMCADIAEARRHGLAGVVLGAGTGTRTLDQDVLRKLIEAADGLELTLHRVVDTLRDPVGAVEVAIALGFKRILTSGGAKDAASGAVIIEKMHHQADGRIGIMAGSGVTPANVAKIAATGVRDFHASCRITRPNTGAIRTLGFGPEDQPITSAVRIKEMQNALASIAV